MPPSAISWNRSARGDGNDDVGLRQPFPDSPPTCYQCEYTTVPLCSQRACPGIREDAWWRNACGRGHRQNHFPLPHRSTTALTTLEHPRRPFGTSPASLYPSRSLPVSLPSRAGLTYCENYSFREGGWEGGREQRAREYTEENERGTRE